MQIELRQIDPSLWLRFTLEAKHRGTEVSELVSEALQLYLGITSQANRKLNQQIALEDLGGTWSEEESEEFERNLDWTRDIDAEMWK